MLPYCHMKIYGEGMSRSNSLRVRNCRLIVTCRFLKKLRLVAVDELHYYSGIFGRCVRLFVRSLTKAEDNTSHVAQVIRRLRRICAAVGSECSPLRCLRLAYVRPQDRRARFVSCSATISKPQKHMENLFGIEVRTVTDSRMRFHLISCRISKKSLRTVLRLDARTIFCGMHLSLTPRIQH